MFKALFASLALLGLVACSTPAPVDLSQIINTASVELDNCSGVLVDADHVLTAAHCTDGGNKKEFNVNIQGKWFIARLVKVDLNSDLALLVIPGVKFKGWVEVSQKLSVKLGEDVFCIGNPRGILPDTLTKGIVAYVDRLFSKRTFTQLTCDIAPGNSGGMVLNADGKLIGITTAGFFNANAEFGSQWVFASTLKQVQDFLR